MSPICQLRTFAAGGTTLAAKATKNWQQPRVTVGNHARPCLVASFELQTLAFGCLLLCLRKHPIHDELLCPGHLL